jgi:hypothetical protein
MDTRLFPIDMSFQPATQTPQDEKLFRVFFFIELYMDHIEQNEEEIKKAPLLPLSKIPVISSDVDPIGALLCELYKYHITPEPDEVYQKKICSSIQLPYLVLRCNPVQWRHLSLIEKLRQSAIFAASLFTASNNDPDCIDMDGMLVVSTCISQHPQFDMCHILYSELLFSHIQTMIDVRTILKIVQGGSATQYRRLMEINQNIFIRKNVHLNTFVLACLLFSMDPVMAIRNYNKFPLGNEIMLEVPAFAADTDYFSMPSGIPLQITDNMTGLVSQIMRLVDHIGCGIESAPSEYVERTLRVYATDELIASIQPQESDGINPMAGSYLFKSTAQLTYDVPWLALLCECVDPAYLIINHDYIFVPRKNRGCLFYIVIITGTLFGIEMPSGFIRYEDAFDLVVDCMHMIRYPGERIYSI